MSDTKNEIMSYVVTGFLLLGGLFGMQIMTFIFASLGPDSAGLTVGSYIYNQSERIQNNSLTGIETYTEGADTQFNTLTIAITLILLIGLFVIFWKLVMSDGLLTKKTSGNFA